MTEDWTDDTQVNLVVNYDGMKQGEVVVSLSEVRDFVALIRPVISEMVELKTDGQEEKAKEMGDGLIGVIDDWVESKRL
jgi:uncharacterized protein YbjQ (UPF0145 family)